VREERREEKREERGEERKGERRGEREREKGSRLTCQFNESEYSNSLSISIMSSDRLPSRSDDEERG
jgi:hypothetical protein